MDVLKAQATVSGNSTICLWLLLASLPWLSGCAAGVLGGAMVVLHGPPGLDSHENFKSIMSGHVGRRRHDPDGFIRRYPDSVVAETSLPNGNTEIKYKTGRWMDGEQCHAFFEVDKTSEKIVNWRFEGTKQSCAIVP